MLSAPLCMCASDAAFADQLSRCGNVAAILELDEHLEKNFKVSNIASVFNARHLIEGEMLVHAPATLTCSGVGATQPQPPLQTLSANPGGWLRFPAPLQVFEAAPQDSRGVPAKKAAPDYFL